MCLGSWQRNGVDEHGIGLDGAPGGTCHCQVQSFSDAVKAVIFTASEHLLSMLHVGRVDAD